MIIAIGAIMFSLFFGFVGLCKLADLHKKKEKKKKG